MMPGSLLNAMGWEALANLRLRRLEQVNADLRAAQRTLWFILKSNNGYTLERSDMEDFPGDDKAIIGSMTHADGSVTLAASVRDPVGETPP